MMDSMTSTIDAITAIGIVPVVVIDDPDRAVDLAHALLHGGIGCAEFTLRTPGAIEAIRAAATVPGFITGAGTVLTVAHAEAAVDAGASFVVSPGFDQHVSRRVTDLGAAMVPGIATPTELQQAIAEGFTHVKVFPAGILGGPLYLDALSGPFPGIRFLPSGGVGPDTLADYLSRPHVFAGSGSWMAPREAIDTGDFALVRQRSLSAAAVRDRARRNRDDAPVNKE
jgi:2-dehydro-3-deoxyphosphogluconate aldolase/(4S)-4-hydroxy-2-oxoglutarate aldolase